MRMKQRKPFTPPSVMQTVFLQLEEDLLLGPSGESAILAAGQDYFEWNTDVENTFGGGPYSVDDWIIGD